MKDKLLLFTMLCILGLLGSIGSVHATANTLSGNWTVTGGENCTITVLSTAQKASYPVVATKFLWNVTLKVNNTGATAKTCEVYYTGYKNIQNDAIIYNSTGSAIATVTTGTDAGSRRYWNFTSESISATTAIYESIVFNFTTSAVTQATQTQRLIDQTIVGITNNAEVTVSNINASSVSYDTNWATNTIRIWDCGTDATCADIIGNASGKTEITTLTNDTTSKAVTFVDSSLPTGTSYYAIEGSMTSSGDSYYYTTTIPAGSSGSVIINTNTGQQKSIFQEPIFWILVAIVCIIIVFGIYYGTK